MFFFWRWREEERRLVWGLNFSFSGGGGGVGFFLLCPRLFFSRSYGTKCFEVGFGFQIGFLCSRFRCCAFHVWVVLSTFFFFISWVVFFSSVGLFCSFFFLHFFSFSSVLKFIHVVNNDTIMHAVETCTDAFSTQS